MAALLLMLGWVSFQVRGNVSKVLADSTSAVYLKKTGAGKSAGELGGAGPSVNQPPDPPLLVSQIYETKHHRVVLSWSPGVPAGVIGEHLVQGYNVYRRRELKSSYTRYARINGDIVPDTTFVDDTVRAGWYYDYHTTAVNELGVESAPSNQIRVGIPYP
ncbi:MAG: hypothetical protein ACRD3L_03905 [Terriglobales bacterium]